MTMRESQPEDDAEAGGAGRCQFFTAAGPRLHAPFCYSSSDRFHF